MKNRSPICVDLFCGAGGLSTGLEMAGFTPVYALDFDKNAVETYAKNHPNTLVVNKDVRKVDPKEIIRAAGGREIDLLAGGPSCQGFSTHGKRDADDPRNFLFEQFLRIAKGIRPKWILIENVQGLLTYNKGYFKDLIISRLADLGYRTEARVLCAADYGVPQLRRRIFFIATRTGVDINFPMPTHSDLSLLGLKPYVTVAEAIGDLPLMKGEFDKEHLDYRVAPANNFQRYARSGMRALTLHKARPLSSQALAIAKHVSEGEGLRSVPVRYLPDRFKKMRRISNGSLRRDCTTLYYRLSRNKPSYTITCYFRNIASGPFLHPLENRSLSYREAARLMSFQDSYEFRGVSVARQIGNAVPPLLAKAVGKEILRMMQDEGRRKNDKAGVRKGDLKCRNTLEKID